MTTAFGSYFPGITIVDALGAYGSSLGLPQQMLNIGPSSANQGAFTGVFQNRLMPSANAIWTKGNPFRHLRRKLVPTRSSMSVTCAQARERIATPDFSTFAMNWVTPYYY